MRKYGNVSGQSGIEAYETGPGFILVRFVGNGTYKYTVASAGRAAIRHMKRLAAAGKGLSTFISQFVRENYEEKIDDSTSPATG